MRMRANNSLPVYGRRVVLTNETGERMEFTRGDSFVVPAGFTGTWEVLEECRKLYAIFEPRRAP